MAEPGVEFADVLANCLDGVEEGRLTAEECLDRYPALATELAEMLSTANQIRSAPEIVPSSAFRLQARSGLLAQLKPMPVKKATIFEALSQKWRRIAVAPRPMGFSMAWGLVVIAIATLLIGGGMAYASDASVPGQPLYALDRSLEEIQAGLTRDPEALVAVQLSFADERLAEAQKLTGDDRNGRFQEALDGYGESITSVVQTIDSVQDADRERLGLLLDEAIPDHDDKLVGLAFLDEDATEDNQDSVNLFCASGQAHPVAQSLAEGYDVDVEQIMAWFCGSADTNGFGFGQINLALQKEIQLDQAGPSAGQLLERRASGQGWGQIWRDLGIIGKQKDGGMPDSAGPKEREGTSGENGPPDHASDKNRGGPPDHAGPKDNNGPPDHAGRPDKD